ncbi:unnamed protein product [Ixodes pacificus]
MPLSYRNDLAVPGTNTLHYTTQQQVTSKCCKIYLHSYRYRLQLAFLGPYGAERTCPRRGLSPYSMPHNYRYFLDVL